MEIIDSHVHFGLSLDFDMKKEHVLYAMEKYGVSKMIVSCSNAAECDHDQQVLPKSLQVSQIKAAEDTIGFARENFGRIYAALWLKPLTEGFDESLYSLVESNIDVVKALKFHPYHSAVPFDDERIEAYMPLAEKYSLPVITHTGDGMCDGVERVAKMAERHPNVKFVMAHLGLGTDNQRAIELAVSHKNIYGDTAWVPMLSAIQFLNQVGEDRLFFGSDTPIDGPETYERNRMGQRSMYQDYFHLLPRYISARAYEKLMYRNAKNIFSL